MFCRKCGKELPEGAKFCNHCGTPCGEGVQHESQPAPEAASSQVTGGPAQHSVSNSATTKTSSKPKALIPAVAAAGILLVVVIWLFMDNAKKPEHVSESGDYTLQINETFQFKSTKSSIRFTEISFGEPQYDSTSNALTAPVTFSLRVDIPGKKYKEDYKNWLNEFSVNGIQATSSAITYLPDSDDCYLMYSVHYDSVPADQSYLLTCNVSNRLTLHFAYDQSFWDNVDYAQAIAAGQAVLDEEYGIEYVDWQNGANSLSYVEDKVYCMTGKVQSCGEYMWGITDQYYITLTAKGALVDTHCYFSRDEWNRSPDVNVGDVVTFYGTFKFESFGWNFEDCTFTSPAGTFAMDGDKAVISSANSLTSTPSSAGTSDYENHEEELPDQTIDLNSPFGYYEDSSADKTAIAIMFLSSDDGGNSIEVDFYESWQGAYHGGQWMEPTYYAMFDEFDYTDNDWQLIINGVNVYMHFTETALTVTADGSIGNMSAELISGIYTLKDSNY